MIDIDSLLITCFVPAALLLGCLLDLLLGDPAFLPHPVRGIGWMISCGEKLLRRLLPLRERAAGTLLVVVVLTITIVLTTVSILLAWLLSPWLAFAIATVMSWQAVSARCLAQEAGKVRRLLEAALPKIPAARRKCACPRTLKDAGV